VFTSVSGLGTDYIGVPGLYTWRDAKEIEGALLHDGGRGKHHEWLSAGDLRDDAVLSQRCQILEQRAKAVHGQVLGGSLGLDC